jgi:hypothetical protein
MDIQFPRSQLGLYKDSAYLSQLEPNDAAEFDGVALVQNQRVWEGFQDIREGFKLRDKDFLERLRRHSRFSFDPSQLKDPFNQPTLIITGRQDHMVGYQDQWDILENYPRATFARA